MGPASVETDVSSHPSQHPDADPDQGSHPVDGLPLDPDIELDVPFPPSSRAQPARPTRRVEPRLLVAISLGAMAGATARYQLAVWIRVPPGGFPWATFWTNISGSFVLGLLLVLLIGRFVTERFPTARDVRAAAGTGFLGAYTTFSTFSVETDVLLKDGHATVAASYVVASLVVGITAAWAGILLGRLVPAGHPLPNAQEA